MKKNEKKIYILIFYFKKMKENNQIIIDADIDKDNYPKFEELKELKEEQINSFEDENEYLNEIKEGSNKMEGNQMKNGEYNNYKNKNETEDINNRINNDINNDINNNNLLYPLSSSERGEYNQDKIIFSQKESFNSINNINDNISTVHSKEEQYFESNNQNPNINFQKINYHI